MHFISYDLEYIKIDTEIGIQILDTVIIFTLLILVKQNLFKYIKMQSTQKQKCKLYHFHLRPTYV